MPEPLLTTGLMAIGYSAVLTLSRPGTAVSPAAEYVRRNASSVAGQFQRSMALFGPKAACISSLHRLVEGTSFANWDGYGAEPVNQRAFATAQEIIASLPDDLSLPECSVEPDGAICLDWIPSSHRTLTISIGDSDRIPYAWIDGSDRGHAVSRLVNGQLPARVVSELRRFIEHEFILRAA